MLFPVGPVVPLGPPFTPTLFTSAHLSVYQDPCGVCPPFEKAPLFSPRFCSYCPSFPPPGNLSYSFSAFAPLLFPTNHFQLFWCTLLSCCSPFPHVDAVGFSPVGFQTGFFFLFFVCWFFSRARFTLFVSLFST